VGIIGISNSTIAFHGNKYNESYSYLFLGLCSYALGSYIGLFPHDYKIDRK